MNYHIYIDEEVKEQAERAVARGQVLNLKNDIVFKSFFSKDCAESAYCRKKMLSAVIGRTITDTTVLNPAVLPSRNDGKYPRLDIHCTLDDGSEVDIELQNAMYQDDQIKRSIYYAAALTHNALSAGKQYLFLPHIYQIFFMNFKAVKDKRLHHTYLFQEKEDHVTLSDIVQIHYVELPKITELLKKQPKELSELEFWSMLILAGEHENVRTLLATISNREEELTMAQALLQTMSNNQQEWENQFGYEKFIHDCISREQYAFTKGERTHALETARRMLQDGLVAELAAKYTGLSLDEVKQL